STWSNASRSASARARRAGRRRTATVASPRRPGLVVRGQLLGEEGQRPEQEQAHDDQREVFVHGYKRAVARQIGAQHAAQKSIQRAVQRSKPAGGVPLQALDHASTAPASYSLITLTPPPGTASRHSRQSTHSSRFAWMISSVPSSRWPKMST